MSKMPKCLGKKSSLDKLEKLKKSRYRGLRALILLKLASTA